MLAPVLWQSHYCQPTPTKHIPANNDLAVDEVTIVIHKRRWGPALLGGGEMGPESTISI